MNPDKVLEIGQELLDQYKLKDWKIALSNDKDSYGFCFDKRKCIEISRYHLDRSDSDIIDTIKHEIAHSLVGCVHQHDSIWVAKAKEIGVSSFGCKLTGIIPFKSLCPSCSSVIESVKEIGFAELARVSPCQHLVDSRKIEKGFESIISNDGYSLKPYQLEGARFIETSGARTLLADAMRVGKTVQTCAFIKFHKECYPVLITCKSNLMLQWLKEIYRWTGLYAHIIESASEALLPGFPVYITSMDLLHRIKFDRLMSLGIKTIIGDEVQHFKNFKAKRSQAFVQYSKVVDYIIGLSGTPFKNRGSEYFTILHCLHPERFSNEKQFDGEWVDYQWNGHKYVEGGIRNLDRFREYTKDFIIRREREDVEPFWPKVSRTLQYVDLNSDMRKAYAKAEYDFLEKYKQSILDGKEQQFLANAVAEMQVMRHLAGIAKIGDTVEWVKDFIEENPGKKIALFRHHNDVGQHLLRLISDFLKEKGLEPALEIVSEMDYGQRDEIVQKFRFDASKIVLVASTLASGEGINLQPCGTCVMVERQWNPANEEQAECRFIGGDNNNSKIDAIYMVAGETFDEHMSKLVERKREMFNRTMSGKEVPWDESELITEMLGNMLRAKEKREPKLDFNHEEFDSVLEKVSQ